MGWKDWPAWLKGGVIVSIIYLFIMILVMIYHYASNDPYNFIPLIFLWLFGPGLIDYYFFSEYSPFFFADIFQGTTGEFFGLILSVIIILPIYFLLGALIGWIYGKIKSRKQEQI